MYDGTEVTMHATKGVIHGDRRLCGQHRKWFMETNTYWDNEYVHPPSNIGTTNRSSLTGRRHHHGGGGWR